MSTQLPAHPIGTPPTGNDTRFSVGLAVDVAALGHRHGHPPFTGVDLVGLRVALFNLNLKETR